MSTLDAKTAVITGAAPGPSASTTEVLFKRQKEGESTMSKLDGKVAVITGATSGMALATAALFAAEGAHVFITGRRKEKLDEAVAAIGHNVTGVQADSGDLDDLTRLAETVREQQGRVDVLFASAGFGMFEPLGSVTPESFDTLMGVNFRGTVFTVQYLLPLMSEGASIILNGSTSATKGVPGAGVYSATKAAVRSLARTWAAELKDRGIRVNVISPGSIDTALFATVTPGVREQIISGIPLGRLGTSEEIAAAALYFASADSSFVTGANLVVDGGFAHI
jgi:NAD(P)-dependent dehydrogenase (short-subunit alcohol dehydrogenase family)